MLFVIKPEVAVDVGGRANIAVPEPFLNAFQVVPLADQEAGRRVPLRYNNDKPEKSRIFKGEQ